MTAADTRSTVPVIWLILQRAGTTFSMSINSVRPVTALEHLLRAQPNLSLDWIATNMPIREEAEREHYLEGFRRAGLT